MTSRSVLPAHGGDVVTYRERFGREPLDFSANSNPLGMSPAARIAAADALHEADRYPDPLCRELRAALATRTGVSVDHVICGNGAADLIWRLVLALRPCRALVCAPTFSEYESALRATSGGSCLVVRHELSRAEGFALTGRLLDDITPDTDVVFLCVPNNPTGLVPPRALLEAALARCEECGALLVVDECFNGFLPDPDAASMRGLVEAHPHLLVLGAFTKLYGMAGLRLGWALCSDEPLLSAMRAAGQAWPVSNVAQAAGVAALSDDAFIAKTRVLVAEERPRLAEGLRAAGCTVYPGQANYLFFEAPVPDLCDRLASRGILIRDCANYPGLRPGDCRVAVRTPIENDALLRAVRDAVGAGDQGEGAPHA
ncbi:MAG: aminotransferase class I/II-fold pyridoxal phosphate-dependent enzyme [Coriobacteriia bacterium]|nr:aminotransferase class I/II-fold pyridoxal phosphate-dependent enzyme [Coriobacteriia bacterium]MBS5477356.1 aminotransferase class I/II-fold pyridoxal phosphate-dependent enzyme [Coriobacteriia bacterium]